MSVRRKGSPPMPSQRFKEKFHMDKLQGKSPIFHDPRTSAVTNLVPPMALHERKPSPMDLKRLDTER